MDQPTPLMIDPSMVTEEETDERTVKIFGRKFAKARKKAGYSQASFGIEVGYSASGIYKVERQERAPIFTNATRLWAKALKMSQDEFYAAFVVPDTESSVAPPAAPLGGGDAQKPTDAGRHSTPLPATSSQFPSLPATSALPPDLAAQVRSYAKSNDVTHDAAVIALLWGGIREWQEPGVKKAASGKPRGGDGKPPKK
jgi:transcriptional regulator with XRE-family HTH domain